MKKKCLGCGNEFYVKPSRQDIKYCSLKCRFPEDRLVELKCATCGRLFNVHPSRKNSARYCSPACQHKGLIREKLTLTCKGCGDVFHVRPGAKTREYCTKVCRGKHQTGVDNPSWKGGLVTKQCVVCGKDFKVKPSQQKQKCCSMSCRSTWWINTGHSQKRIKLVCAHCAGVFETQPYHKNKKFCSNTCYHAHYKAHPELYNTNLQKHPKVTLTCPICRKPFKCHPSRGKRGHRIYCSKRCAKTGYHIYRTLGSNPNWRGGLSFEPYGPAFNYDLKEAIRYRDNYTCQVSGKTETELGHKLSVHHIDYDKTNNAPSNLISISKKIHGLTNGNRPKWTQFFRKLMRDRKLKQS